MPSLAGTATATQAPHHGSKLLKRDRLRVIEARTQQRNEVTLLVATVVGSNEAVMRAATSLGGRIQYRDDDVSYLRVRMPTNGVDTLAQSTDIETLNVDGAIDYLSSPPDQSLSASIPQHNRVPPPNRDTLPANPYLPTTYMGVPQFIAAHRTFDGRGVTVAVVDTSIDLLLPELQTAKTLDGSPTPKFADILTAAPNMIDPTDDGGRLGRYIKVEMREQVTTHGAKLTYKGMSYSAPADGDYRIGSFDERTNNPSGDLNRDGNPDGSKGEFSVLWSDSTNTVWVDTNQNLKFDDEKAMTDYRVAHNVGIFGRDNPKTSIRETVGFTVQTDQRHKAVIIIPGYGGHGTGVVGSAFGKSFFGGGLNGAAPEAQVVVVPYGNVPNATASVIESLILAVKDPRVDIVTTEAGYGGALNDGGSVRSIICNRLVEKYHKPIFAGAENGSGDQVNYVQESGLASEVITVGSYINRETIRVNYGGSITREDNIDAFSSRGPRKDGGFKPNILAPTTSLSTKPGFLPGENRHGTYDLPSGYQVYGGTSTATPMAAAGAALLISAAKQSGVPYDAKRLRWAIMSSARYLPDYGANEQGAGLFDVGAAWKALQNAPQPIEISSLAPVNAALSQYLRDPNQGPGIYEREGWIVGKAGQRTVTFTRASGGSKPITYSLRWVGNDGTYVSQQAITLPLNKPVELSINIKPKSTGVHSAILNLDEKNGARSIYQMMNTIVAAEQFTVDNGFSMVREGLVSWMDGRSYSFNVPAHARAIKVDVRISHGNVMPYLMRPVSAVYYELARGGPTRFTDYQTGGSWSRVIPQPEPGVWQLVIINKNLSDETRFTPQNQAKFIVNIAALGVESRSAAIAIDQSATRASSSQAIAFTNHLGSFTGGVSTATLGSAFTARPTLTRVATPQVYEINVAPASSSISARIGAASDIRADLDLYLFDCTGNECVLKDFSQRDGSNEEVEVENPAAGKWRVVIDPFFVPSGKTSCTYQDFFTNSAFGLTFPIGKPSLHIGGSTWKERVNIQVGTVPASPRYLAGLVAVTTDVGPNTADQQRAGSRQLAYPRQVVLGAKRIKMKKSAAFARWPSHLEDSDDEVVNQ